VIKTQKAINSVYFVSAVLVAAEGNHVGTLVFILNMCDFVFTLNSKMFNDKIKMVNCKKIINCFKFSTSQHFMLFYCFSFYGSYTLVYIYMNMYVHTRDSIRNKLFDFCLF